MTASADTVLDAFLDAGGRARAMREVTLRDVAAAADTGLADLYRLYPDKMALVAGVMARVDAAVLAGTPRQVDPEETARDRLFDVMMRRYDALKPHREALRSIVRPARRDPAAGAGAGAGGAPLDGGDAGGCRPAQRGCFRCSAAERPAGDLLRGIPGVRRRRNGRPLQDHGGPGQPPQDGRALGANL